MAARAPRGPGLVRLRVVKRREIAERARTLGYRRARRRESAFRQPRRPVRASGAVRLQEAKRERGREERFLHPIRGDQRPKRGGGSGATVGEAKAWRGLGARGRASGAERANPLIKKRDGRNPPWRGRSALSIRPTHDSRLSTHTQGGLRPRQRGPAAARGRRLRPGRTGRERERQRPARSGRGGGPPLSAVPTLRRGAGRAPDGRARTPKRIRSFPSTSGRARGPAGFKHITKRRKRN